MPSPTPDAYSAPSGVTLHAGRADKSKRLVGAAAVTAAAGGDLSVAAGGTIKALAAASAAIVSAGGSLTVAATPPQTTPGTITQLGAQTLYAHIQANRQAIQDAGGETVAAATSRMQQPNQQLAYCGAVLRANRYWCAGVSGGHAATNDDGFYEFDTQTGSWITRLACSPYSGNSGYAPVSTPNAFGEFDALPGRPSDQHNNCHLVAVGDDVVQAHGYSLSYATFGSRQAHVWKASTGQWSRFGTNSGLVPNNSIAYCFYDAARDRIVKFPGDGNVVYIDVLSVSAAYANPGATAWQTKQIQFTDPAYAMGYNKGIGYHPGLDCYVMVASGNAQTPNNRIFVMDPNSITAGTPAWVPVATSGVEFPITSGWSPGGPGLEYCPPMNCMVAIDQLENNRLYYATPTGARTNPWVWTTEVFTGTASTYDGAGPNNKLRWVESARGLVICKQSTVLVEKFVPRAVAEYYDWFDRSTAANVVAAYDFSAPPANGGDWKWGSLSATPKTTVYAMGAYDSVRVRDTAIFPPGSRASLRFDVPQGTGERADAWRISIDNYADQFGDNSEFWLVWRMRMNAAYNETWFQQPNGSTTGPKYAMVSAGMQDPYVLDRTSQPYRTWYGYEGPSSNAVDNVIADARIDSQGEIVTTRQFALANASHPTNFSYFASYVSKYFHSTLTFGSGVHGGQFTYQNGGTYQSPWSAAKGWFSQIGDGDTYADAAGAFKFPNDEWFSCALHIKLGPHTVAAQSSLDGIITGYANSSIELLVALSGATSWTTMHKREGVVMPTDTASVQGAQGVQRYGQFGLTTFMTSKNGFQVHPLATVWFGQVIVLSGATVPATPGY